MYRVISIIVMVLLLAGLGGAGYIYYQKSGDVDAATKDLAERDVSISGLTSDISKSKTETAGLTENITATSTLLTASQGKVTDLESTLRSVNSQVTAALSTSSALAANVKKIQDPRHFSSLTELNDWLKKDDTNTKYASIRTTNYLSLAYILQVRATRDGYILPAYTYSLGSGRSWISNLAYVGDKVYLVEPGDDSVTEYFTWKAMPSHPEPLP